MEDHFSDGLVVRNFVNYNAMYTYIVLCCTMVSIQDGMELPLKDAGPGDSVHSMLSILNAIIGSTRTFKSVAAKATRDSYVLQ